jgi:hypothetical protein
VEAEEDGKKCRKGLKITIGLIYKINFSWKQTAFDNVHGRYK